MDTQTETVPTLELLPGVDDSHVCRNGVKATAADDVDSGVSRLTVVVQLHGLQELYKVKGQSLLGQDRPDLLL